ALCEKYGLPYTIGPLHRQYGQALRTIMKLSLPNRLTSPDKLEVSEDVQVAHGRKRDSERPSRRTETGGYYRTGS
ncbi:MAG TPA: acyl-CoA desaturase, partial [Nocardioides sp.]|nr:acyl-CoA desaturase [Nocardioides sp.]